MTDRKNGPNTGRNKDGTFGQGNPGKPKGARHKATLIAQKLLDGECEALTRTAIERAKEGDMAALRLCLERIVPPRKDTPIVFNAGTMESADHAAKVLSNIMQAVSKGELTPAEGAAAARLVETYRRVLEIADLERRIEQLEKQK